MYILNGNKIDSDDLGLYVVAGHSHDPAAFVSGKQVTTGLTGTRATANGSAHVRWTHESGNGVEFGAKGSRSHHAWGCRPLDQWTQRTFRATRNRYKMRICRAYSLALKSQSERQTPTLG
jgi:hypothetical protein